MLISNPLGKGQSQPGAAWFLVKGLLCTVKALENMWKICLCNTDTAGLDCERNEITAFLDSDCDPPAGWGITASIIQQDSKQSLQRLLVAQNPNWRCDLVQFEIKGQALGRWHPLLHHLRNKRGHCHGLQLHLRGSCIGSCAGQEVFTQRRPL